MEVLKTLKTHLTPQKKTVHRGTMRKKKARLPSCPQLAAGPEQADNGTSRSRAERAGEGRACSL